MSDNPTGSAAEVRTLLQAISRLLRGVHRLGPEAQRALADLIDELSVALEAPDVPNAEIARLTECTSHLVQAIHENHEPGILAAVRERLDHAVVAIETKAPTLAGLTRRLAEMLSNVGI